MMKANELKMEAASNGWIVTTREETVVFSHASLARHYIDRWQFDYRTLEGTG